MKEGNNVICLNLLEAQTGMDQSCTSLYVLIALDTLGEIKNSLLKLGIFEEYVDQKFWWGWEGAVRLENYMHLYVSLYENKIRI